jgi:hypothetical protein
MTESDPKTKDSKTKDSKSKGSAKALPPAAVRALAEAQARRAERDRVAKSPTEIGGRDGPDPVRYGDWEVKGVASDF